MTTTRSAQAGARGVRRVPRGAAPDGARAWSCSTATGAARRARSTWCCATGDVLVVCEVKTRSSVTRAARPTRRSTTSSWPGCGASRSRWVTAHRVERARRPDRPGRGAAAAARAPRWSTTSGGSADAVRHRPHRVPAGRAGPPHRRAEPTSRPARSAPRWSVGRTPPSTRRGTACRMAVINSGLELARHPADHDPALAGRPAQARHPLRPRDRGLGARGRPAPCPARPGGHRVHRRADAGRRAALRARGAADGAGGRRARASAGSSCPSRRRGEAAMVPGHGGARHALPGPGRGRAPGRGGARGAAGRRRCRARRLLAWRGAERLEEVDLADLLGMADARYAVEVAAAGGHHLLLSGPKGVGQDQHRRADPDDPARPRPPRSRSS